MEHSEALDCDGATRQLFGPVVVAVRGPSRSGKSTLCELLIAKLNEGGLRSAWVKRTHHAIDLPGKSSDRVWSRRPAATLLLAGDRLALTLPACEETPATLISHLPEGVDVVLLETHTPTEYPAVLAEGVTPGKGEFVLGRWRPGAEALSAGDVAARILPLMPLDTGADAAIRAAIRLHGGHGCAGLILGARLALAGARTLGVDVPDRAKRLIVVAETDRCAVDGIQAVTGCRPGKRTLRLLDYGKLAATFLDEQTGRAVRVAARGDLRDLVGAQGPERRAQQRRAYATWPEDRLFTLSHSSFQVGQFDRPGPPRVRVRCRACDEEVSDGRHIQTEAGAFCRPCAREYVEGALQ